MAFKTKAEKNAFKRGLFAGLFGKKKNNKNDVKSTSTKVNKPEKTKSGFNSLNDVPNWCKRYCELFKKACVGRTKIQLNT